MARLLVFSFLIFFLCLQLTYAQKSETDYLPIAVENIHELQQIAVLEYDLDDTAKAISQLEFHPTEPLLFSQEVNETVRTWDMEKFEFVEALPLATNYSTAFAISPDGQSMVYGGWDYAPQPDFASINLWNFQSRTNSLLIRESQHSVDLVVFNHDGTLFATAGLPFQGAVQVWRPDSEALIFETGYWNSVYQIAFTADNRLITAGLNREVSEIDIWDMKTAEPEATLDGYYFVLHPSEPIMVVSNVDMPGGKPSTTVFNLEQSEASLERDFDGLPFAFDPTGNFVVVTQDEGVWLCDFETGEKLFKLRDYGSLVIAFSSDSRFIATVEGLGSISIWGIPED